MSSQQQNTFPALAKWKFAALVLGITAAIFGLLYSAEFIPPNHPVFRTTVQSFAALLLTSGILSIVLNFLVRHELAKFWLNAIGVRDAVSEAGLYDIGLDFSSYDFHTLIRQATRIDLCVIHADKWIGNRQNDFTEFLSHKDHELRVCLLAEDAPCGQLLAQDFRYKDGQMAQKIGSSIEALKSCIKDVEKTGQSIGWIRIWNHQRIPKHTYYRFDDLLFLVPYNLAQGHTKIPVIGFSRKPGGISDFLGHDFENMLKDHAKKIYDSREKQVGESGEAAGCRVGQESVTEAGETILGQPAGQEGGQG